MKTRKTRRLLLLALLFQGLAFSGISQENKKNGGRVEALKVAYLTKKLDLSAEEAQRFWPLYNNYMKEIRQTRQEQKEEPIPVLEWEEKLLQVRKKYEAAFTRALNAEKANTFFRAEKAFLNYLQRELNKRNGNS